MPQLTSQPGGWGLESAHGRGFEKDPFQPRSAPGLGFTSWLSGGVALGLPVTGRLTPHCGATLASLTATRTSALANQVHSFCAQWLCQRQPLPGDTARQLAWGRALGPWRVVPSPSVTIICPP